MIFTRQCNPISNSYSLNDISLQRVTLFKDLDINTTVSKFLKVMGFIKRNTSIFKSTNCFRIFYFTIVRSILEYGAIIWHPYLAKDVIRLERVQNLSLMPHIYLK